MRYGCLVRLIEGNQTKQRYEAKETTGNINS